MEEINEGPMGDWVVGGAGAAAGGLGDVAAHGCSGVRCAARGCWLVMIAVRVIFTPSGPLMCLTVTEEQNS